MAIPSDSGDLIDNVSQSPSGIHGSYYEGHGYWGQISRKFNETTKATGNLGNAGVSVNKTGPKHLPLRRLE